MRIEAMCAERADDWIAFFDGVAFTDNPVWAGCYCRVFEFPHASEDWEAACGDGRNRAVMLGAAQAGAVHGFLAYDEDAPVGWCRAGGRGLYRGGHSGIRATDPADDDRTLSVVCFVIAPSHRRRGLARALLEAAVESAGHDGYAAVEAYALRELPTPSGVPAEAELFRGPRALFDKLGFESVAQTARYDIMRRALPVPSSG